MSFHTRSAAVVCAAATLLGPLHALSSPDAVLEEIVVKAKYRDTSLHDAVGSISVLSNVTIQERAAQHLEDILNAAPNVTFSAGSSRSRFVQVRGIGDLEQYYEPKYYPSVGMMLDSLELGDSANAGMLYDVAQVEVLRGPQGTRFGASAHAGMINIISNAPTDKFEGVLSGGLGNYDSYNVGAVLSGPLSDGLKGRIAVQQNRSDGYIDNDALNRDDTNDFDELTARTRLQWNPTDTASYEISALYFDADNGHDAWSLDNSRTTWTDQPGKDKQETFAFTASGNWLLGDALSIEAAVSYIDMDLQQSYDADWTSAALCDAYLCSGGYDTAREIFDRDRDRLIADVRVLGGSSALSAGEGRYVIGLYFNDSSEDFDYQYPSIWYGDSSSSSDYDTDRYALYGEYEYAVTDRLTVTAGARLERFEDDYSDANNFRSKNNENLWNGELSARYDINDNTMSYLTVARSAKPGGINVGITANQGIMSPAFQGFTQGKQNFDEENLLNTEVGIRTRQLDQRLSLNLSLFYTERDDAQLENWMYDDAAALWLGYLDSTGDATSYGLEIESSFAVNEAIELFANIGWLHTEVDSIEAFDQDLWGFVTKKDRDLAKAPDYQYNVGARVAFAPQWSGRIELEGQDDSYYGYYHDGKLDDYDLLNASLNWQPGNFNITLWGRNLTDKDYAVHGLYFPVDPRDNYGAWTNQTYTQLGEPRTYGIEVKYTF